MTEVEARAETVDRLPVNDVRGFHFPGFDGLRAIAAVSVALVHSAFISGFNLRNDTWGPFTARLDIGVAVFFVISGFLLYRPFVLARFRDAPAPGAGGYFKRRFLRIFPAFWLVFTLVLLVPQLHGLSFQMPSAGGLVAHYTLTHIYFHAHVVGPVQQSWTLATELSFYLFLPLYAFALRRVGARWALRAELGAVAFLYLFSVGFRLWLFVGRPAELNGMYNTWLPARIDLFALGMLLAVLSAWWAVRPEGQPRLFSHPAVPWVAWSVALLSFWYLSVGFGLNDTLKRGPVEFSHAQQMWLQFFWGVSSFFLVLPAVFGPQDRGAVRRFLANRAIAWTGLVSYGIYLWHEAVIDWYLHLTNGVAFGSDFAEITLFMAAGTAVVAALSYYLLERPVLRLKDRSLVPRRARATEVPR